MSRMLLMDGNSILNRAFYGIMGNKMLMTEDGTYTNAVYGFLSILFKVQEELTPDYIVVAFDKKGPTKRHHMYQEYKANRKGMPEELAMQIPMIKQVLQAMNITMIEKEGYEGDDIIGTLSRLGETNGLEVTILSGDRDNFQLATDHVTVEIPRTKAGKTETDYYDRNKVIEEYGVEPHQLIQVKGLMGDTSDNIPGVPGVGEKTALQLIKDYTDIDQLYEALEKGNDQIKGKLREKLVEHKELAFLSRELGRILVDVPIEETLEDMKKKEWNEEEVLALFKTYRFQRFIDRFSWQGTQKETKEAKMQLESKDITTQDALEELKQKLQKQDQIVYHLQIEESRSTKEEIIPKQVTAISVYLKNMVYHYSFLHKQEEFVLYFKELLESKALVGYELAKDYILLKQMGITPNHMEFDVKIAAYLLNPVSSKYPLEGLSMTYAGIDFAECLENRAEKEEKQQLNLFEMAEEKKQDSGKKQESILCAYAIGILQPILQERLEQDGSYSLFTEIEMPLTSVLADMQYVGMRVDAQELMTYGTILKEQLEILTKDIYELAGVEFNINSPKQLGEVLFEKLQLPYAKKTKSGYSTDVDALEKIQNEHPVVSKILEYRGLMKLNSTYVEGLLSCICQKDQCIHSSFHQTVTATGRISSTDPNLQNIPTRLEAGKKIRKAFIPREGHVFLDADYSQIELRILAHISQDAHMIQAFQNDEDIHKQAASKVLHIPMEEVTKEQRSDAKAVNFGIVYGISDFGLAEQLKISKKQAKEYIDQYLEQYSGIQKFMEDIVEEAKEKGFVETLFHRRRQIPELKSSNYMVRQFGARAAMNTPIQGTAADIMKIAMIAVWKELQKRGLASKLVLQVHDELLIDTKIEEIEEVKEILKTSMEQAANLCIPLKVELSQASNWYEAK